MLQFDVNISILLKEVPFLERFERAAQLNFGAVEFWWPGEENLVAVAQRVQATGLQVALMNFDAGNMAGGERGFLNDPARQQWFRSHVPQALDFAATIGCPRLNALVGNNIPGESREAQMDLVRENLAWAADRAAGAGLGVVVEAVNSFENSRYLLTNTAETLQLLAEVNRPNLKYQYDIYHMQRMEGNLIDTLRKHIGMMGHIQVADSPERHEPGTGEIHYAHVLAALDELGYRGYIGLEYNPATSSEASFSWLPANRRGPLAVSKLGL
ncbi:MAG: hydroxypyruvate isomerase family protein [Ktedonobacteraceae bacterium]